MPKRPAKALKASESRRSFIRVPFVAGQRITVNGADGPREYEALDLSVYGVSFLADTATGSSFPAGKALDDVSFPLGDRSVRVRAKVAYFQAEAGPGRPSERGKVALEFVDISAEDVFLLSKHIAQTARLHQPEQAENQGGGMLRLALPVVLTYLGLMLMGIVDVIVVGQVSANAIGAVGVGTSLFTWFMIFGIGLLAGLDYLVAFAQGADRPEDGHRAMVQSLIATTLLSIPLTAALYALSTSLDRIGIHPDVQPAARSYLQIIAPSLWPVLVFSACRQYLTAMSVTWPALAVLFVANVLNAALNYAFALGHWGAPALGADGSAIATLLSRVAMMLALLGYLWAWDRSREGFFGRIPFRYERAVMREFLRLGFPSALHMTFEVGVFALSTTLAARLAPTALAAHQIVLNIASMTFMVPLGVSSATAVLVGQAFGAGRAYEAVRTGWKGFALGVGFMACSGLMLTLGREPILSLFTTDPSVRELAGKILFIAALFQLSDGAQVVGAGALRGLGDTRSPAIGNLCGHWLVGLPLGLYLCFSAGWGLSGLWTGLSVGLTCVAVALTLVWRMRIRQKLAIAL